MEIGKLFIKILCVVAIDAIVTNNDNSNGTEEMIAVTTINYDDRLHENLDDVFNGVYTECFLHLSYSCLQNKTLLYLKELNNLSEVSVIGDYVKFVKLNTSKIENIEEEYSPVKSNDELAYMIDKAIDNFFDNHVIKFTGLGREISMSNNAEEFVGRKKRKGGGGGGHGGDDGGGDGGKKKMMMMAMMCMKMKLMMMVPAMMGMMGMMSFKGMMFSLMSFMASKMMLLMKILEKKGGASIGGAGAGADGGWAASAGGGGAWMPAGGQDYAGGGYDANGQWQSRSIFEKEKVINKPTVSYVDPIVRYSGNIAETIPYYDIKRMNKVSKDDGKTKFRVKRNLDKIETYNDLKSDFKTIGNDKLTSVTNVINNEESELWTKTDLTLDKSKDGFVVNENHEISRVLFDATIPDIRTKRNLNEYPDNDTKHISRKKRSIIDAIQNSYIYWVNKILGLTNNRRTSNTPKYKMVNGIKYVYYPFKKARAPKDNKVKMVDDAVRVITAEDFNKGEIVEGGVESRMNKKKFHKMKDSLNDTIDENPWE